MVNKEPYVTLFIISPLIIILGVCFALTYFLVRDFNSEAKVKVKLDIHTIGKQNEK